MLACIDIWKRWNEDKVKRKGKELRIHAFITTQAASIRLAVIYSRTGIAYSGTLPRYTYTAYTAPKPACRQVNIALKSYDEDISPSKKRNCMYCLDTKIKIFKARWHVV